MTKEKKKPRKTKISKTDKLKAMLRRRRSTDVVTKNKHQPVREVHVDASLLPQLPEKNKLFLTNKISTTKYNWFNFIPKSLLIQFMRVSNIYFLITVILICIPGFSPLDPYTAIGPLAFVLMMSMLREAYEDYKRRRNDNITNHQKCKVMRKKKINLDEKVKSEAQAHLTTESYCPYRHLFQEIYWSDLKCGDIIFVEDNEHFPADTVLLMSSAENGECFVQTSSLDGERALKHKQCLEPIQKAIEQHSLSDLKCTIHCEAPNKNLYSFSGYMESSQLPETGTILLNVESDKRTISLDNKQLVLRGSNLANTNWIIGVVTYTGKQTKLMMNQGLYRFKQSKIERMTNVIVIWLIIIQAILCFIMALYSGFYTSNWSSLDQTAVKRKAEYIFYSGTTLSTNQTISYTPSIEGLKTYAQYYILLNTIIPISLVVSMEFIKLLQTPFIQHDVEMYDEVQYKQAQPISLTLHEELGAINYIFADKTGTLTANVMQFMACSVGSVCYDEDYKEEDYDYQVDAHTFGTPMPHINGIQTPQHKFEEIKLEIPEILDNSVEDLQQDGSKQAEDFEKYKEQKGYPYNEPGEKSKINRRNSITEIVWNFSQSTSIIRQLLEKKKYFLNEEINLGSSDKNGPELILSKQNEYLKQFWLNISLCHDVISTIHPQTGKLCYQGTSPDEITLLDAAKEVGFMFTDRTSNTMTIDLFGVKKVYKLLLKLEFNSDRKKMSVVVEDLDTGMISLFCKGADFAIFERLSIRIEQHFLEATKEDLIKFSTKGYRTLCFAIRVLDRSYIYNWINRYESAKLDILKLGLMGVPEGEIKELNALDILQNELESELFLLGATALEDKLQDGVPETIEDFHNAGIKVWMLTGDKLETAENIGFSSKMFNEKMYIFKLQTKDKVSTRQRLAQIDEKMEQIEFQHAKPIIGTQFILNPNAATESLQPVRRESQFEVSEARNIIQALEEYKHESKASEFTLNESWARKPVFRRKIRKRLEEIVPDRAQIVGTLVKENQFFQNTQVKHQKYIPNSFDQNAKQYLVRRSNIYRSQVKGKEKESTLDNEDTFGILVEGQTLHFIMDSTGMKAKFLKILAKCQAVVVCRASPSQKALVVQLVKENEKDAVTLAIGDGANDVNMIQKAHVGIGIFGKEGYQAVGSSDYAIGQFKFLRRLMFVHGRWNAVRLSTFMIMFFHKNLVFTIPQFWYGWQNGFSGQTFWEDAYLTVYNTFVTAFAVGSYAIWEQDINLNDKRKNKIIELFFPFLYKYTVKEELFTKKKFFVCFAVSLLQSLFIFGIPVIVEGIFMGKDGKTFDLWDISMCSYFSMVHLHYLTLIIFTRNFTLWTLFWYLLSYLTFLPGFVFGYNAIDGTSFSNRAIETIFNGYFWLIQIITVGATLLPVYFYQKANSLLFPSLKDLINQDRIDIDAVLKEADPKRYKAAHDLFKQKQQQQLLQWQLEYQNFQAQSDRHGNSSHKIEENKQEASPMQQNASQPNFQLPRKGLSLTKSFNSAVKNRQVMTEDLLCLSEQERVRGFDEVELGIDDSIEQSQKIHYSENYDSISLQSKQDSQRKNLHRYNDIFQAKTKSPFQPQQENERSPYRQISQNSSMKKRMKHYQEEVLDM